MNHWGVLTWVMVLALIFMLLVYWKGAAKLGTTGAMVFGSTVRSLTGTPGGKPIPYAGS